MSARGFQWGISTPENNAQQWNIRHLTPNCRSGGTRRPTTNFERGGRISALKGGVVEAGR